MRIGTRPWGRFELLHETSSTWLKRIIIAPGQSLSYQYHLKRAEYWMPECKGVYAEIGGREIELYYPGFMATSIPPRVKHRLFNPGQYSVSVLEWATGRPDESDIVRLSDIYGR